MSDIAILVACHTEDVNIPDNGLLYPIQVGTALSDKRFEDMLHDDEGDNISEKNEYYCELTALYWAWKNLKTDYIGLFHYRRYLSFADESIPANNFGDVVFETNDEATLEQICLDDEKMYKTIESYDIILPVKSSYVGSPTIREQYRSSSQHEAADLDISCQIIEEKYPEMVPAMNAYLDGIKGYFCNMFIMRSAIFNDYCEWLFGILEEHEKRADFSDYNKTKYRVSGYLAERLFGIYITYLESAKDYKIEELQRAYFKNVEKQKKLKPAFPNKEDAVRVVFSANDDYVPYLSALLESIKDNASESRYYDLVVMHQDISKVHMNTLQDQVQSDWFSLRFFNTKFYMSSWQDKLKMHGHFKVETYFRLLLQDILEGWHKVLYLDADMVVLDDVAKVYDTDISGYLLAAVKDADTAGLYNGYKGGKKQYMDEKLRIAEPYGYFQAGVILFNLDMFREKYDVTELFEFSTSREWDLLDQDVLNYFAQGFVKYLPMRWNVMMDWENRRVRDIISKAPHWMYDEYMQARKDPAICHYAGNQKPWTDPDCDMAEHFWRYSRKTPFYEIVLTRMLRPDLAESLARTKRQLKSQIKDSIAPAYEKMFPSGTKQREVAGHVLRKFRK